MKKITTVILIFFVNLVFALSVGAEHVNLVKDGQCSDELGMYWNTWASSYNINFDIDHDIAFSGETSFRIESVDGQYGAYYQWIYLDSIQIGKQYMARAYIRTENLENNGAEIAVGEYKGASAYKWHISENIVDAGTQDWTKVIISFTIDSPDCDAISLNLRINYDSGRAWFDSVAIWPADQVEPPIHEEKESLLPDLSRRESPSGTPGEKESIGDIASEGSVSPSPSDSAYTRVDNIPIDSNDLKNPLYFSLIAVITVLIFIVGGVVYIKRKQSQ